MAWRLNDGEREALNYLVGGVVVVVAVKLLFRVLDAQDLAEGDARLLTPFRQGYFLGEGLMLVDTSSSRLERLALACVLPAMAALLVVGGAYLAGLPRRIPLRAARVLLVALLAWCAYAALFRPLRAVRVADHHLVVTERRALLGDIPLPFTGHEERIPAMLVDRIEVAADSGACSGLLRLQAVLTDGSTEGLGRVAGPCPVDMEGLRKASEAAMVVETALR